MSDLVANCYKMVERYRGRLYSLMAYKGKFNWYVDLISPTDIRCINYAILYKPDIEVFPKLTRSKIFVFDSPVYAGTPVGNQELWSAYGTNLIEPAVRVVPFANSENIADLHDYWDCYGTSGAKRTMNLKDPLMLPPGTMWADSLVLLERIA